MPKPPSFPMYARDWLIGTAGMSPAARGVYIDLLCYQWINGSVPAEEAALARLLRVHHRAFAPIWREVEPFFPVLSGGLSGVSEGDKRANNRLIECRIERDRFVEDKRNAAQVRWKDHASACAEPMPASASSSASSSALHMKEPPTPLEGGVVGQPKKPKRKRSQSQEPVDIDALPKDEQTIVRFWQQQCRRPRSTPVNADLERVREFLKDTALAGEYNETVERLVCMAIKGCAKTPFNMGENPTGARHNDLALIFRDQKHVRQFVDTELASKNGTAKPANGNGERKTFTAQRADEIAASEAMRPELQFTPEGRSADLERMRAEARASYVAAEAAKARVKA